jgi:hypothetical protein
MPKYLLIVHATSIRPDPRARIPLPTIVPAGPIISSSQSVCSFGYNTGLGLRRCAALDTLGGWSVDVLLWDPALIIRLLC